MQAERSQRPAPTARAEDRQGPADDAEIDPGPVFRQVRRAASRALALPPEREWTNASLRRGAELLGELAARHGLTALEPALLALLCHPLRTPRAEWSWQVLLPARGLVPAAALGDEARMVWTLGGACVEAEIDGAPASLPRFYSVAFGDYLPHFKHRLAQPCIYHRVLRGLERNDAAALSMAVTFPVVLTIADEG